MSKKIVVSFIVVLLLGVGGVFWWQSREIKGSPEDYVIRQIEGGIVVENKRAGLTMKAPEGWIVEKIEIMEGSIVFYTLDIASVRPNKKDSLPLKMGCMIEVAVRYEKTDLEEIQNNAEQEHKSFMMKFDQFEIIELDRKLALKNTFNAIELGHSVDVYVPGTSILYGFGISAGSENVERCFQEFDEFFKTVSIE